VLFRSRRGGDWSPLWDDATAHFSELAALICRSQRLIVVCPDVEEIPGIRHNLLARGSSPERFRCCWVPADDTWSRDFGPIGCVLKGKPALLNFRFNAWGGKYASQRDDAINRALQKLGAFAAPLEPADFVLEGGSIESDGAGSLLTTSRCLLSAQRNSAERAPVEAQLKKWLPVERILWLESGHLAGDDTDSHIDNLARFADSRTILYVKCTDPALLVVQTDEGRRRRPGGATATAAMAHRPELWRARDPVAHGAAQAAAFVDAGHHA
jgi:agmatine deiminase